MHLDAPPAHGDFCVRSLSVPEVATDPGVSVNWVSGRIRRGVIRIDRDPDAGHFLFPDTDRTMRALRQLRTGAIARIAGPVFLPNGFVLAASLNRCRRRMPWTVLQSTSVRLGERCPSAVNCRAISQDRLRLLFAARPDRDPSILADRHGAAVLEYRGEIHGPLVQSQHLLRGIAQKRPADRQCVEAPGSAVAPSAVIARVRIGPPCPLNCAAAGARKSIDPISAAQQSREIRVRRTRTSMNPA